MRIPHSCLYLEIALPCCSVVHTLASHTCYSSLICSVLTKVTDVVFSAQLLCHICFFNLITDRTFLRPPFYYVMSLDLSYVQEHYTIGPQYPRCKIYTWVQKVPPFRLYYPLRERSMREVFIFCIKTKSNLYTKNHLSKNLSCFQIKMHF